MVIWDYGTVVPFRYLVPNKDIPVINLSVTWAANLEETYFGEQQIGKVLRESEKRTTFISSGALSHNLVSGSEAMPSLLIGMSSYRRFLEYLNHNDLQSAWKMPSQYARTTCMEAGGCYLAAVLGVREL
jgi:3,4-dihydroxyphenylacetate 2,3-dioxygenase